MAVRVGASAIMATNGGAPTAITVHTNTNVKDLLLWYHYSAVTGGAETVVFPAGWTQICQFVDATGGLIAVAWRIRTTGDTTYISTITGHTSGTSGEGVLQWIETWTDNHPTTPISGVVSGATVFGNSLNMGAFGVTGLPNVDPNGTVIVFGGRRENLTGQTLLTGNGLSWTVGTQADTSLGLDAGACTQWAKNNTISPVTMTSKTITTTGTAQVGKGVMFVLAPPPAKTIGGVWPESSSFIGPIKDVAGNLYTITEYHEPTPQACIRKSHDGGDTWLEMDYANRPVNPADDLESLWLYPEAGGEIVHMLSQRSGTMGVYYSSFATSDHSSTPDVWLTRGEVVEVPGSAPANQSVSLVQRDNGDLFAFYRKAPVTNQRLGYRKKPVAGAWSATVEIDTTASKDFTQVCAVLDPDGVVIHIFYLNDTDSTILYKTLNGSDVLSSPVTVITGVSTDNQTIATPPVVVDRAGTKEIWISVQRASDSKLVANCVIAGVAQTTEQASDNNVGEDPTVTTSEQTIATLAVDPATDKIYAPYADDSTRDLFLAIRNGAWGTDTELIDAIECQFVCATVFNHSSGNGGDKVLGIIYDENPQVADATVIGIPKYHEVFISAGASPGFSQPHRHASSRAIHRR